VTSQAAIVNVKYYLTPFIIDVRKSRPRSGHKFNNLNAGRGLQADSTRANENDMSIEL
jgi:hypothetical protein